MNELNKTTIKDGNNDIKIGLIQTSAKKNKMVELLLHIVKVRIFGLCCSYFDNSFVNLSLVSPPTL